MHFSLKKRTRWQGGSLILLLLYKHNVLEHSEVENIQYKMESTGLFEDGLTRQANEILSYMLFKVQILWHFFLYYTNYSFKWTWNPFKDFIFLESSNSKKNCLRKVFSCLIWMAHYFIWERHTTLLLIIRTDLFSIFYSIWDNFLFKSQDCKHSTSYYIQLCLII